MVHITKLLTYVLMIGMLSGCIEAMVGTVATTGVVVAQQDRTVGDAVDDLAIWTQIKHLYLQKDINQLFTLVDIKVNQGRVLLTGEVRTPEARIEAVRVAWQADGVKEVLDELQVQEKLNPKQIAKDSFITTQIKGKLLLNKDVKSINYNVETVNGIVYLMGLAQNEEELDRATREASTVKNVKRVISHVRVKAPDNENTIYNR